MTGYYPDAPANRLAWHVDGSAMVRWYTGQAIGTKNSDSIRRQNSLQMSGGSEQCELYSGGAAAILFPVAVDLSGYYLNLSGSGCVFSVETSTDTTTGQDGTWTERLSASASNASETANGEPVDGYRTTIKTLSGATGITGIRFLFSSGSNRAILNTHLYGVISGASDRLEFWHPTLDQRLGATAFDFSDSIRGSAPTKTFRIKNRSATLQANSITVGRNSGDDGSSNAYRDSHTFDAGSGYASSVNIGNLAAGAISGVITLKMAPDGSVPIGSNAARMSATASSWT